MCPGMLPGLFGLFGRRFLPGGHRWLPSWRAFSLLARRDPPDGLALWHYSDPHSRSLTIAVTARPRPGWSSTSRSSGFTPRGHRDAALDGRPDADRSEKGRPDACRVADGRPAGGRLDG